MRDGADIYRDGRHYDLLTAPYAQGPDLAFYLRHALAHGGEALELGCGTGRLTIPLAAHGVSMTGLDNSPAMLARAQEKAVERQVNVAWVQADCRAFDLGRTFGLIFFPANALSHLLNRESQEACLASIRRHLAPGGEFIAEVFNPSLSLLTRDPKGHFPIDQYHDPESGKQIVVMESVAYDAATQINHAIWYYHAEGEAEPESLSLDMRLFYPQEFDTLLHYNGFAIDAKYGDFAGTPFSSESMRQIVVCRAER